jgi:hypothetical protein
MRDPTFPAATLRTRVATGVSIAVSALALAASIVALYRSYLAPARIEAVPGGLRLRLYDYSEPSAPWWMPVFHVTVTFANVGARAGTVDGLRLRVRRTGVEPADNFETFHALVTLNKALGLGHDTRERRDRWLEASPEWSRFLLLGQRTLTQNLVFQSGGWGEPIVRPLEITLEMHGTGAGGWNVLEGWTMDFSPDAWPLVAEGMPMPGYARSHVDPGPRTFPEHLLPQT